MSRGKAHKAENFIPDTGAAGWGDSAANRVKQAARISVTPGWGFHGKSAVAILLAPRTLGGQARLANLV